MIPPNFEFKRIISFKDSFSRQLAEALYIEKEGNLNKRLEYGYNHLYRLESNLPAWELQRKNEREAKERANYMSNLYNFVSVISNVKNMCKIADPRTNQKTFSRIRKRSGHKTPPEGMDPDGQLVSEEGVSRNKIRRMNTSTPRMEYRNTSHTDWPCSPLKLSPYNSSKSIESLGSSFHSAESENINGSPAGLSPQLRKLLIRPRNTGEESEIRELLITTINLTRAAFGRGFSEYLGDDQDVKVDKLEDNTFYRFSRKTTLISELMEKLNISGEKEAIVILGRNVLEPWDYRSFHSLDALLANNLRKEGWRKSVLWEASMCGNEYIGLRSAELIYLDFWCREFLLSPEWGEGVSRGMEDVFKIKLPDLVVVDTEGREFNSPRVWKRKFHLEAGAQMGSLTKHNTSVKKNDQLRKRLNQTFFSGGPVFSLQKENPTNLQTPSHTQTRARRRLNVDTSQQLITSIFSPKSRAMYNVDNGKDDPDNEFLSAAKIGRNFQ